jgi:lsr operon transcriptional repressor
MARAPKLPQIDTEERFLAQVAWAYHVEGLTQETWPTSWAHHAAAREQGPVRGAAARLVRITFNTAFAACAELEAALKARHGLRQAYVAPAPMDARDVQMIVGAALGMSCPRCWQTRVRCSACPGATR